MANQIPPHPHRERVRKGADRKMKVANGLDVCIRNLKRLKHRKAFPLASTQAGNRRNQNDYAVAKHFISGIRGTTQKRDTGVSQDSYQASLLKSRVGRSG